MSLTASDTAFSVAYVRARESTLPASERLFEDPYAAIFHAAGAHAEEGTKRFMALPFFTSGVRLRTRFIDDFVRQGLANSNNGIGIDQVVLLGAGFDARGLRMPEIPAHKATVYEIDFADQLERKHAILAEADVSLPEWVKPVACDFNVADFDEPLTAALVDNGFRQNAGAIFVWEGVIPYIGAAEIDRSLRFMARVGGPRTQLAFDFAPIAFDPDPAIDRVRRAGFSRFEQIGYDEIWRRYLPGEPEPHATIPHIGMAFVE